MTIAARFSAVLLLALVVAMSVGCGGQPAAATTPSDSTPPTSTPPPPPTAPSLAVSIQASPATLSTPGPATLSWTSTGAGSVSIDQGIGAVAASGSLSVSVSATTTWTITAKDATGASKTAQATVTFTGPPQVGHVVVVVFENEGFNAVFQNPAAPLINQLATQYSLATNFYAVAHPSLKDYFMLTTGQIASDGLVYPNPPFLDDNVIREAIAGKKSWKGYFQGLPNVGYTGKDVGPYTTSHNPLVYFSDVLNDPVQANNIVPLEQLATDLSANALPNLSFVIADQNHIMHDCPVDIPDCNNNDLLTAGDTWLKTYVAPVLINPAFQKDGVLIIVWDEAEETDDTNGGGHVMMIMAGPMVKPAFQSNNLYQDESLLRFICESLHLTALPGAAKTAPPMDEFLINPPVRTTAP